MLADREVVMNTAYNGHIFNAQIVEESAVRRRLGRAGARFRHRWASSRETPKLAAARQFVHYATRSEVQAAVGRHISYSPARHSGTELVSTHLATGVDMKPHMPTSPQNMKRVLYNDWGVVERQRADDVNERFSAWLAR